MFDNFLNIFMQPEAKLGKQVKKLKDMEDITDQMQEQITAYLIECSSEGLNEAGMRSATAMIRIVNELESVGDSCYNLILASEQRRRKKLEISKEAVSSLKPITKTVAGFLKFIKTNLEDGPFSDEQLQEALDLEARVDKERKALRKASRKRIQKGSDVKAELLYLDIVKHIEHIGDYALNIAEAIKANHQD